MQDIQDILDMLNFQNLLYHVSDLSRKCLKVGLEAQGYFALHCPLFGGMRMAHFPRSDLDLQFLRRLHIDAPNRGIECRLDCLRMKAKVAFAVQNAGLTTLKELQEVYYICV